MSEAIMNYSMVKPLEGAQTPWFYIICIAFAARHKVKNNARNVCISMFVSMWIGSWLCTVFERTATQIRHSWELSWYQTQYQMKYDVLDIFNILILPVFFFVIYFVLNRISQKVVDNSTAKADAIEAEAKDKAEVVAKNAAATKAKEDTSKLIDVKKAEVNSLLESIPEIETLVSLIQGKLRMTHAFTGEKRAALEKQLLEVNAKLKESKDKLEKAQSELIEACTLHAKNLLVSISELKQFISSIERKIASKNVLREDSSKLEESLATEKCSLMEAEIKLTEVQQELAIFQS